MGITKGHGSPWARGWLQSHVHGLIPTAEDNGEGGFLPHLPEGILIVSRAMSPAVGTPTLPPTEKNCSSLVDEGLQEGEEN